MSRGSPIGGAYVEVGADLSGLKAGLKTAEAATRASADEMGRAMGAGAGGGAAELNRELVGVAHTLKSPVEGVHALERAFHRVLGVVGLIAGGVALAVKEVRGFVNIMSDMRAASNRASAAIDALRTGFDRAVNPTDNPLTKRLSDIGDAADAQRKHLRELRKDGTINQKQLHEEFRRTQAEEDDARARAVDDELARQMELERLRAERREEADDRTFEHQKKLIDEAAAHDAEVAQKTAETKARFEEFVATNKAEKAQKHAEKASDFERFVAESKFEIAKTIKDAIEQAGKRLADQQQEFYNRFAHVPIDVRRLLSATRGRD